MTFNSIPFDTDDRVIHKTNLTRGVVLEIDDGIAYLEMDNGVEMDFHVSDLMLESEYKSPEEERQEEMAFADAATLMVAGLILPEVRNLLVGLAMKMADEAGTAVITLGGTASPWSEMNAFHKMNFICVATHTKFIDWVNAYNDNDMALFQLNILVAMGERAGIK